MPCSECQKFGVAMEMASIDLSSRSLRRSMKVAGFLIPIFSISLKRWRVTFSSTSQTAAISTFGILQYSCTCVQPCRAGRLIGHAHAVIGAENSFRVGERS